MELLLEMVEYCYLVALLGGTESYGVVLLSEGTEESKDYAVVVEESMESSTESCLCGPLLLRKQLCWC